MYYDAENGSACNLSLKCDSAENSSQSSKKGKSIQKSRDLF